MNRLFTRIMWLMAIVLLCVVCVLLIASGSDAHAAAHTALGAGPR